MDNKFTSTPSSLWDLVSNEYNESSYEGKEGAYPANSFRSEILLDFFKGAPRGKVLDAGCGTGEMTRSLLKLGWDVTSVDYSKGMLETAAEKTKEAGLNGSFSHCTLFELEKLNTKFDYIMLNGVLPYIQEDEEPKVFEQLHKVLNPKGTLLSAHYNAYFNLLSLDKWTPGAVSLLASNIGIDSSKEKELHSSISKLLIDSETSNDNERTMKMEDPLTYDKKLESFDFKQFDKAYYNFFYLPLKHHHDQDNDFRTKMERDMRRNEKGLLFFRGFVSLAKSTK